MTMIRITDAPLTWRLKEAPEHSWLVHIQAGRYADGNRIALELVHADSGVDEYGPYAAGDRVGTCTVNLPYEQIPAADCVFVKDYNENEGMADWLVQHGIIDEYSETSAQSGHVQICSYMLTREVLAKVGMLRTVDYIVRLEVLEGMDAPSNEQLGAALEVGTEGAQTDMGFAGIKQMHVLDTPDAPTAGALAKLFSTHHEQPDYLTAEEWDKAVSEWKHLVGLLGDAESFLSGFEDCDDPDDRPKCLEPIRAALDGNAGAADCHVLDDREHATVLAALRYWQREGLNSSGHEVDDIATCGGTLDALTADEIDALCERLNSGG